MGWQNVELAHERWGHELGGNQWKAFAFMALRAWDIGQERNGDPARHYWGGHHLLAWGIGLIEKRDTPLKKSQSEHVRRVVHALTKKHAISVIEVGRGQQHAVYQLHLDLIDTSSALWTPPQQPPLNSGGTE